MKRNLPVLVGFPVNYVLKKIKLWTVLLPEKLITIKNHFDYYVIKSTSFSKS